MSDDTGEMLTELREMRKLLELIAEPAIAKRDANLRAELRRIVGSGLSKQKAILAMDGDRTQAQIVADTKTHAGNLSTMIGKLEEAKLLVGDKKRPKLAILIPNDFFEANGSN